MRMQVLIAAALDSGNMLVAVTVNTSMEGYGRTSGAAKSPNGWTNISTGRSKTL